MNILIQDKTRKEKLSDKEQGEGREYEKKPFKIERQQYTRSQSPYFRRRSLNMRKRTLYYGKTILRQKDG